MSNSRNHPFSTTNDEPDREDLPGSKRRGRFSESVSGYLAGLHLFALSYDTHQFLLSFAGRKGRFKCFSQHYRGTGAFTFCHQVI